MKQAGMNVRELCGIGNVLTFHSPEISGTPPSSASCIKNHTSIMDFFHEITAIVKKSI
jgi:hypothetical protein